MHILGSFPVLGMRFNPETPDCRHRVAWQGIRSSFAATDNDSKPIAEGPTGRSTSTMRRRAGKPPQPVLVLDDHESAVSGLAARTVIELQIEEIAYGGKNDFDRR
jgi:hypothetical protein